MKFYHGFKMTANFSWATLRDKDTYRGAKAQWNTDRETRNRQMREKFQDFDESPKLRALGEQSGRSVSGKSPMGLEQLYTILVDMKRDIKKVAQANCLPSARQYAEKLTKRSGMTHTAARVDLNDDGIDEIVVRDVYGNPVVINGYTTSASTWPERLEYYTNRQQSEDESRVNSKGQRLKESLQEWRTREFNPTYGEGPKILDMLSMKEPEWAKKAIAGGYRNTPHKPKNMKRSAYKALQELLLKPIWEDLVESNTGIVKKNYLSACAFTWNTVFITKAMLDVYGEQGLAWCISILQTGDRAKAADIKAFNKAKSEPEVKATLERLVVSIASGGRDVITNVTNLLTRVMRKGHVYAESRDTSKYETEFIREVITALTGALAGRYTIEPETTSSIEATMTEVQPDETEVDE